MDIPWISQGYFDISQNPESYQRGRESRWESLSERHWQLQQSEIQVIRLKVTNIALHAKTMTRTIIMSHDSMMAAKLRVGPGLRLGVGGPGGFFSEVHSLRLPGRVRVRVAASGEPGPERPGGPR
jgi:hypothetical protein